MDRNRFYAVYVLLLVIASSAVFIAANFSYSKIELRNFNKLNHTDYTIEQWRIYRYDIKELHPFEGQR